jgi:hypothetical protein
VLTIGVHTSYLLDLGGESVEIDEHVDPGICQSRHTTIVVSTGIHVVHTDGVRAQLGHANDVALALRGVDQRVIGSQLVGDT